MKFTIVSLLASASAVVAQLPPTAGFDAITSPLPNQILTPGTAFEIVWQSAELEGTITIHLLQGPSPSLLQDGGVIASGVDNTLNKYLWTTVPEGEFDAYGFNITLDQNPLKYQLSNEFHIAKGSASHPTSAQSVAGYPTGQVSSSAYPTGQASSSAYATHTSIVTLVSNPAYTQSAPSTSSPCTTSTPVVAPTYPASNGTWVSPSATQYPTGTEAPTGPVTTPTSPPTQGAATRFGASGLAAFGAVLLAAFVL